MADTLVEFNLFGSAESWSAKLIYCPHCGVESIWQLQDPYTAQEERPNLCTGCNCYFYISAIHLKQDVKNSLRRLEIMRSTATVSRHKPWLIYTRTAEK